MKEIAEGQTRKHRQHLQCPSRVNLKQGIVNHPKVLGFRVSLFKSKVLHIA